jgi:tetratricopeptide (TPR) repeat protein
MKFVIPLLLSCLTLTAASDEFNKARTLYYRGSDGDKTAYEQAAKLFDALHAKNPTDPRTEVYTGSLRLWEAAHTWELWRKNTLSKEGIGMLDSAVEADPQSLEIRFVRAVTYYSLPSFFHRREQSAQDFTLLATHAPAAASDGELEPRLAAASLYFHGLFLRDSSQDKAAKDAWREAISVAPDSRAARDSAEELKKLAH